MSKRSHRHLTSAERHQRRSAQCEQLKRACRELLSSEGSRRWVRVRAANGLGGRYSFHNQCLLASQARARGIELRHVTGFRTFLTLGRSVRKGEKPFWVLTPMTASNIGCRRSFAAVVRSPTARVSFLEGSRV